MLTVRLGQSFAERQSCIYEVLTWKGNILASCVKARDQTSMKGGHVFTCISDFSFLSFSLSFRKELIDRMVPAMMLVFSPLIEPSGSRVFTNSAKLQVEVKFEKLGVHIQSKTTRPQSQSQLIPWKYLNLAAIQTRASGTKAVIHKGQRDLTNTPDDICKGKYETKF